jgi:hypothetical protein
MPLDKLDISMLEDVGTGANQLVQLDSNAKLPAIDASNLTSLSAAALTGPLPAGDASGFYNLTAANINGTIPDAAFPAVLPARNAQALTNLSASELVGVLGAADGNSLTNINAANLTGTMNSAITYAGDGGPLTNLNANNLGQGTIPDARFPATLPAVDGSALTNVAASIIGDGSALTNLTAANVTGNGTLPSALLTGALPILDGANLLNVPALLIGDGSGLTLLDADAIASGTLDGARFPANLPAVDGNALTNINAANLAGTIPLSNLVVKQVKTYTKANAFSTSSDVFVDVTDMEISITTSAANSRLLVFGHLALSATSNYSWGGWHVRLTRDGTVMTVGTDTTSGNDEQGAMGGLTRSDPLHATHPAPFHEVDVPTVASGTTLVYKVQVAATHLFTGSTCTVYVNRSATPGASNGSGVGVSTITVLEVAA